MDPVYTNFGLFYDKADPEHIAMIAAVGGIGWLIGVICLIVKYKPKEDKFICLANDIINLTFSSVTVVCVISITIFVYNLSSITEPNYPTQKYFDDKFAGVGNVLIKNAEPSNLTDEINALGPQNQVHSDAISAIVNKHIPKPFSGQLTFDTDIGRVKCDVEGSLFICNRQ